VGAILLDSGILTLETAPEVRLSFGPGVIPTPQLWAARLAAQYGRPLPPKSFSPRGEAAAVVNHGRWIARCPCCAPGAMLLSKADRRFWCVLCGMARNAGHPMWVGFPNVGDIRTIETILLMRPRENQNWEPGEPIAQLARENLEHGCVGRIS
jgi:hypothetical protein